MSQFKRSAYREYANDVFNKDGEVEIDADFAPVAVSEDAGAYVQAWIWVEDRKINAPVKCRCGPQTPARSTTTRNMMSSIFGTRTTARESTCAKARSGLAT